MPPRPSSLSALLKAVSGSTLAVILGYVTIVMGVMIGFAVLGKLTPDIFTGAPDQIAGSALIITLIMSIVTAIPGGYGTASLSKEKRKRNIHFLIGLLVILGIVTAILEGGIKPLWWHAGLLILGPCGVVAGARMKK